MANEFFTMSWNILFIFFEGFPNLKSLFYVVFLQISYKVSVSCGIFPICARLQRILLFQFKSKFEFRPQVSYDISEIFIFSNLNFCDFQMPEGSQNSTSGSGHAILDGLYELHDTVGTGGFAKVKVATHIQTGLKVKIKKWTFIIR